MSDFLFRGLNLALATPFDENGAVWYDRLEENIEKHLDAGISSFLLSSGTGIHVYLSHEEWAELVQRGSKIINGRARIIVQTSSLMVEDVVARTRFAAEHGADGVMVMPPFFEGPTDDDEILAFYEAAGEGGLPIIGYNVPGGVAASIEPALFRRLNELPNFVSVKDSRADFAAEADLIRTGLPVLNGADSLSLAALYTGAAGMIWGAANIAPAACVAFVDAAMACDWDRARELWRPLEPLMRQLEEGDYVKSVYAAAEMTGFGAGTPRRPFGPISTARRAALKPVVEAMLASL